MPGDAVILGVVTVLAALVICLWWFDQIVFWVALFGTLAANGLGALLGLVVTYVLRIPDDRSPASVRGGEAGGDDWEDWDAI